MAKESEDELKLKQFHIQNKGKVFGLCRFCMHALHLKLENAVHMPSGHPWTCLRADLHYK